MPLRDITLDDIESLAVGAWVLGTGGGGSPYLGLLNMRALYKEGHRVQLMPSDELADDDWVAAVSNMGAPLVGQERLTDSRTIARAVALMEGHTGHKFRGIMSLEIGGGNSIQPLMAAAHLKRPVIDSDMMGRAYPEAQMTSVAVGDLQALSAHHRRRARPGIGGREACRPGNGWSASAARSASSTARSPRPARRRAPAPR